ncbi:YhgE/Pip domain-containing protein [Paenibacillus sp. DMB20]|uniref:YhgE/Pip domain-containing protein n=1 Tax=Paenibacillus sp. DMB20 TaxID=1642570 RepID=UPI000627D664|nr:YhgE/Pip domain-containing protein [Paenibacillus sp. DMB20]KKO52132.1 YhgE/Pip [Paenibacillus sp. DMB20]
MRNIFRIYLNDLKKITTNWAAAVVIAGLAILPSLYAWFNIAASWDPYSHTSGLSIAVANQDAGTTLRGTAINAGQEIISSLKNNRSLGWRFTDRDSALHGVRRGDDYAAIIIPEDFSARIGTVLTDEPSKAEILYYINEKLNAVAPKVTAKGASGIVEEVSKNFIQTANGAIFQIFNELGIELENQLPTIHRVENLVFRIESRFPELNRAMTIAMKDMQTADRLVSQFRKTLPVLEDIARRGQEAAGAMADFSKRASEASVSLEPRLKQDLAVLNEAASAVRQALDFTEQTGLSPEEIRTRLKEAGDRSGVAAAVADRLADLFGRLDQALPGTGAGTASSDLDRVSERLASLQKGLEAAVTATGPDGPLDAKQQAGLKQLADDTVKLTGGLLDRYDTRIGPAISAALSRGEKTALTVQSELNQALNALPDVRQLLQDANQGLAVGQTEAARIQNRLPEAERQISALADRFRKLEQSGELTEIIDLLKNNFEQESQFFAEPVVLKENRLYPIPNYGSAMSPFFTTLSLWVGALLLVSLLSIEVHDEEIPYRSREVYFGRFLTFLTIAVCQALFVTLGDLFLLGTYVVNRGWFVLFAVIVSGVFMLIVYTLVSVFGNVGKAMAIVLLVLQLAGAGGTFPVQMTPAIFQTIHPYLPFTYAISMMREAVGGILWDVVYRDLLKLAVFTAAALAIGIGLKGPINRAGGGMVRKARQSDLIH